MSKSDIWMPLYIGDYLADTMRLSTLQHGAYLLLLMEYWRTGPLPDDDAELASIAKLDHHTWLAQAPLLRRFFRRGADGLLHQKRADAERARTAEISAKRREAVRVRDAAKAIKTRSNADHVIPHARCRATATVTVSVPAERRGKAARDPSGVRDEFWSEGLAAFRRLTGRPDAASRQFLGQLLRGLRDDCAAAMVLLRQAELDRPGDPAAWLLAATRARLGGPAGEHPLSRAAQMRRVAEIFNHTETE